VLLCRCSFTFFNKSEWLCVIFWGVQPCNALSIHHSQIHFRRRRRTGMSLHLISSFEQRNLYWTTAPWKKKIHFNGHFLMSFEQFKCWSNVKVLLLMSILACLRSVLFTEYINPKSFYRGFAPCSGVSLTKKQKTKQKQPNKRRKSRMIGQEKLVYLAIPKY
jgi:hypothetical protein